jgi:hypothetical protein
VNLAEIIIPNLEKRLKAALSGAF